MCVGNDVRMELVQNSGGILYESYELPSSSAWNFSIIEMLVFVLADRRSV
jgi:hypothetical protein